jgi:two-component system, OmpR family, phosphate regulon sensor histidine kinase PhoR
MRDVSDQKIENKRRDHFLGIASHELKSPLASIKAILQILKKKFPDQIAGDLATYLEKINNKTDNLTYLINDLLDVTRIRQGKLEFTFQVIDINTLIEDVIEEVNLTSKSSRIIWKAGKIPELIADKNRIAQVLRNLLRNALKYSPDDTKVLIQTVVKKKLLEIQVIDHGAGVPDEDKTRVFDLYYRSPKKENVAQGMGVGLFIAAEIVKQHGGKIGVKNVKGGGSVFAFTLPFIPKKQSSTRTLFKTN